MNVKEMEIFDSQFLTRQNFSSEFQLLFRAENFDSKYFSSKFQLIFRAENFDSKNFSSEFQLRNFESKISAWKRSWNSKLKISTRNGISTRRWIDPKSRKYTLSVKTMQFSLCILHYVFYTLKNHVLFPGHSAQRILH